MKISIFTTEKLTDRFAKEAVKEYTKRLSPYTKIEYKLAKNLKNAIPTNAYVISVHTKGDTISSEQLAEKINHLTIHGNSHIVFVLGEYSSNDSLALSKMEMDNNITTMILYEQIYRAFSIIHGRPYHK